MNLKFLESNLIIRLKTFYHIRISGGYHMTASRRELMYIKHIRDISQLFFPTIYVECICTILCICKIMQKTVACLIYMSDV